MASYLDSYGDLLGRRPGLMLLATLALFLIANIGSSLVTQGTTDFQDQVPKDLESIQAFEFVEDEFGGTGASVLFAVEIDPDIPDSGETRDIREPEVMVYMDLLAQKALTLEQVTSARSAADLLKQANGGRVPRSKERIVRIIESSSQASAVTQGNPFELFISEDFSVAVVRVSFVSDDQEESREVVRELMQISDETSPPLGVKTTLTGGPVTDIVISDSIGPTFAITGLLSFLGILVVVVLIFYSLRYGLTSLLAIVFGSTWAFGLLGFAGIGLTENTSGALSLILGIGIDFGIQVVTRFRQELRETGPREAVGRTMPNVIPPMTISALAIFLGFKALSFGNLQFIGELGDIMSIGVVMSYLAAITVVPSVLVVLNTISIKSLKQGVRL